MKLDGGTGILWLFYIIVNTGIFILHYQCIHNVEEFESPKWGIIQAIQCGLLPVMYGYGWQDKSLFFLASIVVGVSYIRDCRIWIVFHNRPNDGWGEWKQRCAERLRYKQKI
ncbi:hypothetical protein ACKLNO_02700 [Neisseriaceae bacterium B1]